MGRGLLLAAAVVVASLGGAPAEGAADLVPLRATLEGEVVLDRTEVGDCFVATPPLLTGTITMTLDFSTGEVDGWLEGSGDGEVAVPGGCRGSGNPAAYRAEITFSGAIEGTADPDTGRFDATATLEVSAAGVYSVPGSQLSCAGLTGLQSECPLAPLVSPQEARIKGRVTGEGPYRGTVDWYTGYCLAVTTSGVSYTAEGCPTRGRWQAAATAVTWPPNQKPVVQGLSIDPAQPVEGGVVVLHVAARDPDGDALSYRWTVDGDAQASTADTLTLSGLAAGDHWVDVVARDGRGGRAGANLGFAITAAPGATEETTSTTMVTVSGSDPVAAAPGEAPIEEPSAAFEDGGDGDDDPTARGSGLTALYVAVILGVTSLALLVGFLLRWKLGWGMIDAAVDAAAAAGVPVPPDADTDTWAQVLHDADHRLTRKREKGESGPAPPPEEPEPR